MGLFAYIKNGVKYKMNQFPGAYPASRVSYNGSDVETALDELNADITANTLGTAVDISSYTSNLYTAPSDGYLHLLANTTGTIAAIIYGASGTTNVLRIHAQNGDREAVFIRKGMRLMHNASSDTGSGHGIYFAPLS